MSNYKLDVCGNLELMDYSNIYDYMGIVDTRDDLTLELNDVNEDSFNMICTMLREQNFNVYYEKKGMGKWSIKAVK